MAFSFSGKPLLDMGYRRILAFIDLTNLSSIALSERGLSKKAVTGTS